MPFQIPIRVSPHDVDPNNIARPSAVLRYMQDTANRQLFEQKPSYTEILAQGKAFVISRVNIETYAPIYQFDDLICETWPVEAKGVAFPRCWRLLRDGELVAQGLSSWALLDINTHKLCRNGAVDMSNYTFGPLLDIDEARITYPHAELKTVGSAFVTYQQIDCNHHMNNSYYPDMLLDFIPDIEHSYVKSFMLRFAHEALLGEKIDVTRSEPFVQEDGTTVYYLRTFTGSVVNLEAKVTVAPIA